MVAWCGNEKLSEENGLGWSQAFFKFIS